MKYIKLFEAYKDIVGNGAEHIAYEIDDNWILKMPRNKIKNERTIRLFDRHIKIMKKYPEIFVGVKKLDKYRASVEKVDTEKADEEIKYFYNYLIEFIKDDKNSFNAIMYFTETYHGILYTLLNENFSGTFTELLIKLKKNAIENKDEIIIKWCNLIEKIENSGLKTNDVVYSIDAYSRNFGIDKNGNIKMIDF